MGTKAQKWDRNEKQNENKVGTRWEQEPKEDKKRNKTEQSGNKKATVGQEWEQTWEKEPKSGTRMGTKWVNNENAETKSGARMGSVCVPK